VKLHVLFRVKHFQKSGRRVTFVVVADLVDLIQNDYRVGCAGLVDSVKDTSRKGTNIGFPVTTQLRLVVHTTEGDPDIFPAQSLCYGFAEAGLTDSRRPVEAQDRGLHIPFQLEDGKIFNDPFLHCVKAVVVAVQDLLGVLQVEVVL